MIDNHLKNDVMIADLLEELLDTGRAVLLSQSGEGSDKLIHGSSGTKRSVATSLVCVLEELMGRERRKVCIRKDCVSGQQPMRLDAFSSDKRYPDGYANVCKACEKTRVMKIPKKKIGRD